MYYLDLKVTDAVNKTRIKADLNGLQYCLNKRYKKVNACIYRFNDLSNDEILKVIRYGYLEMSHIKIRYSS